jgi:lysophospholipase L1-like esterase
MAYPFATAVIALHLSFVTGGLSGVAAQGAAEAPAAEPSDAADTSLSPECRVPGSKLYTIASLRGVRAALKEHRAIRVLAIGSSSVGGIGGSAGGASYPARLEGELAKMFSDDIEVDVVNRGLAGEIAAGASERMRNTVAEVDPDLVVWPVGTNDALARVDVESFSTSLDETVLWLKSHNIDVVLVDPQYTASLARDEYYARIVKAIEDIARKDRVPLVRRFEAMRFLAGERKVAMDGFHLNDLGHRCMAEHVTRAVTMGLLQAETGSSTDTAPVKIAPTAK